jgi:Predicted Na+-dependent transporter
MSLHRFRPDNFTLTLLATVALASLLPCRGEAARVFDWVTDAAIALLFFLHGAKLPRAAIVQGIAHWRLHLTVLAGTFVLFPLFGLALQPIGHALLTPELYLGVVYTAFSGAVVEGLWRNTPVSALLSTLAVCALLLALVMMTIRWIARRLGFRRKDEITIVFCGSKKSMASGIPMARILFAGQLGGLGALVLPLMIFH